MSRINHDNIDKWLFDHVEGKLTPSQERELNSFLSEHPEYELDLDSWQQAHLEDKDETIPVLTYESELLSIAQPVSWKRYAAVAAIALFTGGMALLYVRSSESTEGFSRNIFNGTSALWSQNESASIPTNGSSASTINEKVPVPASSSIERTTSTNANIQASETVSAQVRRPSTPFTSGQTNISRTIVTETPIQSEYNTSTDQPLSTNSTETVASTLSSEERHTVQSETPQEVIGIPNLVHVFDQYRPEIVAEEFGTILASNALEVMRNEPLSQNSNKSTTASTTSGGEIRGDGTAHTKRKKFFDNRLGFINNRDHQLLQPGILNSGEYAAFASTSVSPSLSLNYRNQWSDAEHGSHTARVFYSQFNRKMKSAWGFGLTTQSANNGGYTGFTGSFLFSPKFRINKFFSIEPGVMANIYQNDIHASRLNGFSRLEPIRGVYGLPLNGEGMPRTQRGFDVHFSTLIQTKHFYTAFGVDNLLHPALGVRQNEIGAITSTPTRFKAVIGTDYKRLHDSPITFSPQISFMKQGDVAEIWGGLSARYKWISLGVAGSQNGQVLATTGIHSGRVKLLYQFDVTKSYLNQTYYGSHELALRLSLGGVRKKNNAILNSPK